MSLPADTYGLGEISVALGQRIVDVVGPTINEHINLMNDDGVIIASTDPLRVGARHRAASEVLETGRPVVVDRERPGILDKPGINVPLSVEGRVAGVVGVTGSPEQVEPVARVVALTAELLIEQEREHDSSHETRTRARELIAVLTTPGRTDDDGVTERLAALSLGEGFWSIGIWAHADPRGDGSAQAPSGAEQLVTRINEGSLRAGTAPGPALAVVWRGLVWVLHTGGSLRSELAGPNARSLTASGLDTVAELRSWALDFAALGRRVRLVPPAGVAAREQVHIPLELVLAAAHLPQSSLRRVAQPAARLTAEQRSTVRTLARAASLAHGARLLYVHRNTLLQRVSRIRALTGFDVRSPQGAGALLLADAAFTALGAEGAEASNPR